MKLNVPAQTESYTYVVTEAFQYIQKQSYLFLCYKPYLNDMNELVPNKGLYRNEWREIAKLARLGVDVLFYATPTDYVLLGKDKKIKAYKSDGICKSIHRFLLNILYPQPVSELDLSILSILENLGTPKEKAKQKLQKYIELLTVPAFKTGVDMCYNELDITVKLPSNSLEAMKTKLMYLLYIIQTKDYSYIKTQYVNDEADEYNVQHVQRLFKQVLSLDVPADQITEYKQIIQCDIEVLDSLNFHEGLDN